MVEAATTIHVTGGGHPKPVHVARGEPSTAAACSPSSIIRPARGSRPKQVLAGQRVKLLVKDDGDHYFQLDRGGLGLGRFVERVRERMLGPSAASEAPPSEGAEGSD